MTDKDAPSQLESDSKGGVAAADRALSILLCFPKAGSPLTLAELSHHTGLYKSTILRLLVSLENGALVEKLENGTYALGWAAGWLGASYRQSLGLEHRVRPILRQLRMETGESASFYRRDESVRVCLYREESQQMIRDHVAEGSVLPLDRGAAGHVLTRFNDSAGPASTLLVELPVMSFGERDPEVAALAVPVFGEGNLLAGALTISGPISRLTPQRADEISPILRREGLVLSKKLGASNVE